MKAKADNPMRDIKIEKLVLNISCGEAGDKLMKAQKVLKDLTGQDPVASKARLTIRTFGIKRNEKIACHVTVRGEKADEILKKGLGVKDYELRRRNFSRSGISLYFQMVYWFLGNFGFGIEEHIDLGIKYDPYTGIFGMDFYVVLTRPGKRVTLRKAKRSKLGLSQKVTKSDAVKWFEQQLQGEVI